MFPYRSWNILLIAPSGSPMIFGRSLMGELEKISHTLVPDLMCCEDVVSRSHLPDSLKYVDNGLDVLVIELLKSHINVDINDLNGLQLVCYFTSIFLWSHIIVYKPDSYIGIIMYHMGLPPI